MGNIDPYLYVEFAKIIQVIIHDELRIINIKESVLISPRENEEW